MSSAHVVTGALALFEWRNSTAQSTIVPMSFLIQPGNIAVLTSFTGLDDTGTARSLTSLSATISDHSAAYVALNSSGVLFVVPKTIPAAGASTPITVTFAGASANSTPITPLVIDGALVGPPELPQADHVIVGTINVRDTIGVAIPPDPGTATVTII